MKTRNRAATYEGQQEKCCGTAIAVTPLMTQAGLRILYDSGRVEGKSPGPDALLLEEIFLGMLHEAE